MVWHSTKHHSLALNTGNTFRFGPKLSEFRRKGVRSGTIVKTVKHGNRSCRDDIDILNDGGIFGFNRNYDGIHRNCEEIEYSLNKRRRWELIDIAPQCISSKLFLQENECALVLVEREINFCNLQPQNADCAAYHDSRIQVSPLYPSHVYSYASDLRKSGENGGDYDMGSDDVTEIQYEVCTYRQRLVPHNHYVTKDGPVEGTRRGTVGKLKRKSKLFYFTKGLTQNVMHQMPDRERLADIVEGVHLHYNNSKYRSRPIRFNARKVKRRVFEVSLEDLCAQYRARQQAKTKQRGNRAKSQTNKSNPHVSEGHAVKVNVIKEPEVNDSRRSSADDVIKLCPLFDDRLLLAKRIKTVPEIVDEYDKSIVHCRLSETSVQPKFLKSHFGEAYIEGRCRPRKVAIDLNILNKGKFKDNVQVYLVIEFGNRNLPWSVTIRQNSQETIAISEHASVFIKSNMDDDVVNKVTSSLRMWIKRRKQCNRTTPISSSDLVGAVSQIITGGATNCFITDGAIVSLKTKNSHNDGFDWLMQICGWSFETMSDLEAFDDLQRNSNSFCTETVGRKVENGKPIQKLKGASGSYVCDVCLDVIGHETGTSNKAASSLTGCGHWFCIPCWIRHIRVRLDAGDVSLQCPAFGCDEQIEPVTLLSLASFDDYTRHKQHVAHVTIERSKRWKWCPNTRCNNVVKVSNEDAEEQFQIVPCSCGFTWCFKCRTHAHWPATCNQAKHYNSVLKDLSDIPTPDDDTMLVDVKYCPFCDYPIEKDGGCNQMRCSRCHGNFCWHCLLPWSGHLQSERGCVSRASTPLQTILIENGDSIPQTVKTFSKFKHFRDLRNEWSVTDARSHLSLLCNKIQKSKAKESKKKYNRSIEISSSGSQECLAFLTSVWKLAKQFLFVLEYVGVYGTHCAEKIYRNRFQRDVEQLTFVATRIIELLKQPEHYCTLENRLQGMVEKGKANCNHLKIKVNVLQRLQRLELPPIPNIVSEKSNLQLVIRQKAVLPPIIK